MWNKRVVLFVLLTCISITVWPSHLEAEVGESIEIDTKVLMPPAGEINSRLLKFGLRHFLKETELDKDLDGKKLSPEAVIEATEGSFSDYLKKTGMSKIEAKAAVSLKPHILKALLVEYGDVLIGLQKKYPEYEPK